MIDSTGAASSTLEPGAGSKSQRAMDDSSGDDGLEDTFVVAKKKIKKLCLTTTLNNKAMGRERRSLEDYRDKLVNVDAKLYKAEINLMSVHLALHERCDSLAGGKIMNLASKELHATLTELKLANVNFPSAAKHLLTKRNVQDVAYKCFNHGEPTRSAIDMLVTVMLPYDRMDASAVAGFDVEAPAVSGCDGTPAELSASFLQWMWMYCMTPLAEHVEENMGWSLIASRTLVEILAKECEREDVHEEAVQANLDAMVCFKGFIFLLDPAEIEYAADYNEVLSGSGEPDSMDIARAFDIFRRGGQRGRATQS